MNPSRTENGSDVPNLPRDVAGDNSASEFRRFFFFAKTARQVVQAAEPTRGVPDAACCQMCS
jgi:hypothetical protein